MKAPKLVTGVAAVALIGGLAATTVSARAPRDNDDNDHQAYVVVTGSNIPQVVNIKAIGTVTTSPIRYFDRDEIDKTGAFSTEDVLRHDPSIMVHGFGQAGPNN